LEVQSLAVARQPCVGVFQYVVGERAVVFVNHQM
jgi:hypothetical protein